ncbi:MAG: PfkB family carbohydrate kinase, partial [Desulfobacterales bacterium]
VRRLRAPTVKIESKVGAGDSMVAGMVHGLSEGKSFWEAVRLGLAAGTAAVMSPGSELCRPEDVTRLYQRLSQAPG